MQAKHALQRDTFITSNIEPRDRWVAWCDSISVLFDVRQDDVMLADGLFAKIDAYRLGSIIFSTTQYTPQRYLRPKHKITHDGLDHYLVQLYLEGGFAGDLGKHHVRLRAGDICVIDLSQPTDTYDLASRTCSVVIPRNILEATLPDASMLHGSILRRESARCGLLADHLLSIQARIPDIAQDEAPQVVCAVSEMLGACCRPTPDSLSRARTHISNATLEGVRRYVEQNLASPELSPATICKAIGLSRASLYRLFEPVGGIASYIKARRLERTYAEIIRASTKHERRLCDVAADWGFTSEAHFSRAFRQAFDIAPRDLRASAAKVRSAPKVHEQSLSRENYGTWIAHLAPWQHSGPSNRTWTV